MTWLGALNKYLLQWLCIRLAKVVETEGPSRGQVVGWQILYPIHPRSGWSTDYTYLWGDKMRHITLWEKR